jgi:hypothetical protein
MTQMAASLGQVANRLKFSKTFDIIPIIELLIYYFDSHLLMSLFD